MTVLHDRFVAQQPQHIRSPQRASYRHIQRRQATRTFLAEDRGNSHQYLASAGVLDGCLGALPAPGSKVNKLWPTRSRAPCLGSTVGASNVKEHDFVRTPPLSRSYSLKLMTAAAGEVLAGIAERHLARTRGHGRLWATRGGGTPTSPGRAAHRRADQVGGDRTVRFCSPGSPGQVR
jgi:hypothetical protein